MDNCPRIFLISADGTVRSVEHKMMMFFLCYIIRQLVSCVCYHADFNTDFPCPSIVDDADVFPKYVDICQGIGI